VLLSLTALSQHLVTSLGTSTHLLHHVQLFLKCRHLSINGASNVARWIFYTLAQIWYDVLVRCVLGTIKRLNFFLHKLLLTCSTAKHAVGIACILDIKVRLTVVAAACRHD